MIGLVENPNPNKCLMLDVFVVLHIPGVHRLLPTTSTVQGVNSSLIPTRGVVYHQKRVFGGRQHPLSQLTTVMKELTAHALL